MTITAQTAARTAAAAANVRVLDQFAAKLWAGKSIAVEGQIFSINTVMNTQNGLEIHAIREGVRRIFLATKVSASSIY